MTMLKEGRKEKIWKDVENSAPEVDELTVVRSLSPSRLIEAYSFCF